MNKKEKVSLIESSIPTFNTIGASTNSSLQKRTPKVIDAPKFNIPLLNIDDSLVEENDSLVEEIPNEVEEIKNEPKVIFNNALITNNPRINNLLNKYEQEINMNQKVDTTEQEQINIAQKEDTTEQEQINIAQKEDVIQEQEQTSYIDESIPQAIELQPSIPKVFILNALRQT